MAPGVSGRCSEKACPLPADEGGLCRHHRAMLMEPRRFQQSPNAPDPSLYGSKKGDLGTHGR